MKLFKRFFQDLKKGQNLSLLLIFFLSILIIILNTFNFISDVYVNIAILSSLLIFLTYTYGIKTIATDINEKITGVNLDNHVNDWNRYNLTEILTKSKKTIQIFNRVGYSVINSNFGELKNALDRNCKVQIIIGDEYVAINQSNWTGGTKKAEDYKRDYERCIELLKRLSNEKISGSIEVKTIPVPFPYSAVIIDQESNNAEYSIAPYSYPTFSHYGWQITSNKKESQNFATYVSKDFELAWKHGVLTNLNENKFQSFSILDGQIICGSYPYDTNPKIGNKIISSLLENGVAVFIDLTETGEKTTEGKILLDYHGVIQAKARYINFPINEYNYKTDLKKIESTIKGLILNKQKIFIHCRGGHYRTSLVCTYYLMNNLNINFATAFNIINHARKKANYVQPRGYQDIKKAIVAYITKV